MKVCHVNTFDWQGVAHSMLHRRSVIVHTIFAGHKSRVDAARRNEAGVQVMTMGQLAARLAGGLLQPVNLDVLAETVRDALRDVEMGELEPIKDLPGMPAAVTATFDKAWRAGVDLSEVGHPRTAALVSLEQVVVQRLPASMKRPGDLVALALQRVGHAPAVIGQLEIHGHSEMSPCWRPLLIALAESVQGSWIAGPRHVPKWLKGSKIGGVTAPPADPPTELSSSANHLHEGGEAFRWMGGGGGGGGGGGRVGGKGVAGRGGGRVAGFAGGGPGAAGPAGRRDGAPPRRCLADLGRALGAGADAG